MQTTEHWVDREWNRIPLARLGHEKLGVEKSEAMSLQAIHDKVIQVDEQFSLGALYWVSVSPDHRIRVDPGGKGTSSGLAPSELEASAKILRHLSLNREGMVQALNSIAQACTDTKVRRSENVQKACRDYVERVHKQLRLIARIPDGNYAEVLAVANQLETEASLARRAVNEEAVAAIQRIAPLESKSLQAISDAAERRLSRLGDVNERIGNMLVEVAAGLENILNRR